MIATRHEIGLEAGFRSAGLTALNVFGSGTPQPSVANYSWYFNDEPLFVNGVKEDDVTGYVLILFNTIFLRQTISVDVEGVYVSVLHTSAGEVNVTIQVNVAGEHYDTHVFVVHSHIHVHVTYCNTHVTCHLTCALGGGGGGTGCISTQHTTVVYIQS